MLLFHARQQAQQVIVECICGCSSASGLRHTKGRCRANALPRIAFLCSLSIGRLTRLPLLLATHLCRLQSLPDHASFITTQD
jgi:hypothetical protein